MFRFRHQSAPPSSAVENSRELNLLVELEPRASSFVSNVAVSLRRSAPGLTDLQLQTATGAFWSDVFVGSGMPWRSLVHSLVLHALFCFAVWNLTQSWLHSEPIVLRNSFDKSAVIYYTVSDYLPAIKSQSVAAPRARQGDPKFARQEIISVPPEADNDHQTIITPPEVKLTADRRLPNLVAWTPVPSTVPVTGTMQSRLADASVTAAVIAPPPEVARHNTTPAAQLDAPQAIAPAVNAAGLTSVKGALTTTPAVVEPAPQLIQSDRVGQLNIGALQTEVEAPKLPVPVQQSAGGGTTAPQAGSSGSATVPRAPETASGAAGKPVGQVVALGLDPVPPNGPIEIPEGNRRGTFAATPSGRAAGTGTPEIRGNGSADVGGRGRGNDKLAGISVAPGPPSAPVGEVQAHFPTTGGASRNLMATAMIPHNLANLARRANTPPAPDLPEPDSRVFGGKKFYSMVLNMPNLNSAGGSWVIRFAELNTDLSRGDLTAPVATEKVDPAYPAELIREHLEGTVTLYAVIRSDGTVADVRVLSGVDDRLDEFARIALTRWRFRPATKNGNAVDLEAVIHIPFQGSTSY